MSRWQGSCLTLLSVLPTTNREGIFQILNSDPRRSIFHIPYLASFSFVPALLGEILVDLPQPLVFNQVVLGEGRHLL